jgi:predicted Rossmann-fold nucleotide-binding protein
MRVVYGGGNVGLMGVLADAVIAAGGRIIGVIPHGLVAHRGVTWCIRCTSARR